MPGVDDFGPIGGGVSTYGSPGAAGMFGLQQELARRRQIELQQQAIARQAQQDALDARVKEQQIAASASNTASNEESRQASAELHKAQAAKTAQDDFLHTLTPGDVDAETAAKGAKLGVGHLFGTAKAPGTPGNDESQDYEGQPAAAAVEGAETHTFKGTPDQQATAAHKDFAEAVLRGEHDTGNDAFDQYQRMQATQFLGSGKEGSIPAGVVVPKTVTEKSAERYLNVRTNQKLHPEKVSDDDKAWADVYAQQHPDEAQKQADKIAGINITVSSRKDAADAKVQTDKSKDLVKTLTATRTKLMDTYGRAERGLASLNAGTAVNQAAAIPEFLQVLAGGMGSGLRMTTAELQSIQHARSYLDDLKIKASKLGIMPGQGVAILTPEQMRDMKAAIALVAARTKDQLDNIHDTADELGSSDLANFWRQDMAAASGEKPAAQAGLPAGVTVTRRAPKE